VRRNSPHRNAQIASVVIDVYRTASRATDERDQEGRISEQEQGEGNRDERVPNDFGESQFHDAPPCSS